MKTLTGWLLAAALLACNASVSPQPSAPDPLALASRACVLFARMRAAEIPKVTLTEAELRARISEIDHVATKAVEPVRSAAHAMVAIEAERNNAATMNSLDLMAFACSTVRTLSASPTK